MGFEPTNDGFADHSLRPLGYRALFMPKIYAQSYAQRTLFLPIHAVERFANPLIPRGAAGKQGFCRPLPWATWVPRQTIYYSQFNSVSQGAYPRPDVKFLPQDQGFAALSRPVKSRRLQGGIALYLP